MDDSKKIESESEDVTIQEGWIDFRNGRSGKMAVFFYTGGDDPMGPLDLAVYQYCENTGRVELVDINMDNPRMRVVVSDINAMKQRKFDPLNDRLQS